MHMGPFDFFAWVPVKFHNRRQFPISLKPQFVVVTSGARLKPVICFDNAIRLYDREIEMVASGSLKFYRRLVVEDALIPKYTHLERGFRDNREGFAEVTRKIAMCVVSVFCWHFDPW